MGSQTKDEVFFEETAAKLIGENHHEIIPVTEDGYYGEK